LLLAFAAPPARDFLGCCGCAATHSKVSFPLPVHFRFALLLWPLSCRGSPGGRRRRSFYACTSDLTAWLPKTLLSCSQHDCHHHRAILTHHLTSAAAAPPCARPALPSSRCPLSWNQPCSLLAPTPACSHAVVLPTTGPCLPTHPSEDAPDARRPLPASCQPLLL
jgi:hypothetical protein